MNRILIAVSMLILCAPAFAAAPEVVNVKFETSQGDFIVEVHRDWAPLGADRFLELVKVHFFDDCRFFRVIKGFMAQFGLNGNPKVAAVWQKLSIKDDPVKESNKKGYITFAMAGPNTRTTQLFINLVDNARLDSSGFAPFAKVAEGGMEVVEKIYSGYGEGAPRGQGPEQGQITAKGNPYLEANFPRLDYIKKATIVRDAKCR